MTLLTRRGFGSTFPLAIAAALFLPARRAQAEEENMIHIDNFTFQPKEMKVKVGTTVTWMNAGTTAHSATAIDKSFNTRNLQPGETKSVTFSTPGTFVYHCVFHGNPDDKSGMIGTVIVEP